MKTFGPSGPELLKSGCSTKSKRVICHLKNVTVAKALKFLATLVALDLWVSQWVSGQSFKLAQLRGLRACCQHFYPTHIWRLYLSYLSISKRRPLSSPNQLQFGAKISIVSQLGASPPTPTLVHSTPKPPLMELWDSATDWNKALFSPNETLISRIIICVFSVKQLKCVLTPTVFMN